MLVSATFGDEVGFCSSRGQQMLGCTLRQLTFDCLMYSTYLLSLLLAINSSRIGMQSLMLLQTPSTPLGSLHDSSVKREVDVGNGVAAVVLMVVGGVCVVIGEGGGG